MGRRREQRMEKHAAILGMNAEYSGPCTTSYHKQRLGVHALFIGNNTKECVHSTNTLIIWSSGVYTRLYCICWFVCVRSLIKMFFRLIMTAGVVHMIARGRIKMQTCCLHFVVFALCNNIIFDLTGCNLLKGVFSSQKHIKEHKSSSYFPLKN